jgi:hypothetical protein
VRGLCRGTPVVYKDEQNPRLAHAREKVCQRDLVRHGITLGLTSRREAAACCRPLFGTAPPSCGDFYRCVEVDLPFRATRPNSPLPGLGDRHAVFPQTRQMKFDRTLDSLQGRVERFSCSNATWKIGN